MHFDFFSSRMLFFPVFVVFLGFVNSTRLIDSPRIDDNFGNVQVGDIRVLSWNYWSMFKAQVVGIYGIVVCERNAGLYVSSQSGFAGLRVFVNGWLGRVENHGVMLFKSIKSATAFSYNIVAENLWNTGQIFLGGDGSILPPYVNIGVKHIENNGLISVYQRSETQGKFLMGHEGFEITNNGAVCLYNFIWMQLALVGGIGCIRVQDRAILKILLSTRKVLQTIVLDTPTSVIRVVALKNATPHVIAGFGNGNMLSSNLIITSWKYEPETGVVTLYTDPLGWFFVKFNIGKGYDMNLFRLDRANVGGVTLFNNVLRYMGEVPTNANPSNHCPVCTLEPVQPGSDIPATALLGSVETGAITSQTDLVPDTSAWELENASYEESDLLEGCTASTEAVSTSEYSDEFVAPGFISTVVFLNSDGLSTISALAEGQNRESMGAELQNVEHPEPTSAHTTKSSEFVGNSLSDPILSPYDNPDATTISNCLGDSHGTNATESNLSNTLGIAESVDQLSSSERGGQLTTLELSAGVAIGLTETYSTESQEMYTSTTSEGGEHYDSTMALSLELEMQVLGFDGTKWDVTVSNITLLEFPSATSRFSSIWDGLTVTTPSVSLLFVYPTKTIHKIGLHVLKVSQGVHKNGSNTGVFPLSSMVTDATKATTTNNSIREGTVSGGDYSISSNSNGVIADLGILSASGVPALKNFPSSKISWTSVPEPLGTSAKTSGIIPALPGTAVPLSASSSIVLDRSKIQLESAKESTSTSLDIQESSQFTASIVDFDSRIEPVFSEEDLLTGVSLLTSEILQVSWSLEATDSAYVDALQLLVFDKTTQSFMESPAPTALLQTGYSVASLISPQELSSQNESVLSLGRSASTNATNHGMSYRTTLSTVAISYDFDFYASRSTLSENLDEVLSEVMTLWELFSIIGADSLELLTSTAVSDFASQTPDKGEVKASVHSVDSQDLGSVGGFVSVSTFVLFPSEWDLLKSCGLSIVTATVTPTVYVYLVPE